MCGPVHASSTEVVGDLIVEKKEEKERVLRVGLICGGPSQERGISLNSARSVLDHIQVIFMLMYGFTLHLFNMC